MMEEKEEDFLIPKTLEEAYITIGDIMKSSNVYDDFKNCDKDDLIKYHNGLGQWIRNIYGLWIKKELFYYMENMGFMHPDDMSQAIIESYHARINNYGYDMDNVISECKEYWKKEKG